MLPSPSIHSPTLLQGIWPLCLIATMATIAPAQPANPALLIYATYAAPQVGEGNGLAVDPAGYAYVAGWYPGCGFLTKLNQAGSAAVWSVCLPVDQVNAVVLDTQGYIYVAGSSQNQQSFLSTVMKLSPDAQQTLYSTSIAGAEATNLTLDAAGNTYVSGWAHANFSPTSGAYMTTSGASFAAKLDTSGAIQYATYLDLQRFAGVLGLPATNSIAVDRNGQLWVVGVACPASAPPFLPNCGIPRYGTASGIRKLDANGKQLLVSKTFGGGGGAESIMIFDAALGVALDSTDSAWIVGLAESRDVPITPTALQPPIGRGQNGIGGSGYAVKFSPTGDLVYGTYVGANTSRLSDCMIASVAVDGQDRPHFALNSPSQLPGYATIMILSADGSTVLASTPFNSVVQKTALDGNGGLYVGGTTSASAFLTTPGVYQALFPGPVVSPLFSHGGSSYAAKFDLTKPGPASQFTEMVDAASRFAGYAGYPGGAAGVFIPGEIVSLLGSDFPPNPSVTFDGLPAPILYADATQINAVMPFEVSSPSTVVSLEGVRSYVLTVWPAAPALFTADLTGRRQLAALNEDGSANSSANPAKAGSVVRVFLTGAGAMTPPIGDGQLGPSEPPYPVPDLPVRATVTFVPATVVAARQAPGLIAGAVEVDLQIPAGTASGNAPVVVYVGDQQTQLGTTIRVQ